MKPFIALIALAAVLFTACNTKTPETQPATETAPAVQADPSAEAKAAVIAWINCWKGKDLSCFSSFMAESYVYESNTGTNKYQPRAERLQTIAKHFEERDSINVAYENMAAVAAGDSVVVTYIQHYQSKAYSDNGLKTLILKKEGGKWLIAHDGFTALK